jgi:peroxiredoxin
LENKLKEKVTMRLIITFLLTLLITLNFCLAQEKTQNATKLLNSVDAKQILQKAVEACLKIKTIEYTEEQFHTDHVDKVPFLSANIRQAKAKVPEMGFSPGKFIVEGRINRDKQPVEFAYSYDGKSFRVLDAADKVVQVVKSPTPYIAGQVLADIGQVGFPQFTQEKPFISFLEKGENFTYGGTRLINGTECDVISFTQTFENPSLGKRTLTSRWFIGRNDSLPRGLEIGNTRRIIKILKINDTSSPTDYFIPILNGYSEKLITGKEAKGKELLPSETTAPNWTLLDPDGKSHSLSDYRGKVVILDFWGTWCVPCWKTMPVLQGLHEKFKDSNVIVLGISIADKEGNPVEFMKRKGFTYKLLLNGDEVADLYKAVQLPTLYVIGFDSKIIHAEYGFRENAKEELISIIEQYLKARKN